MADDVATESSSELIYGSVQCVCLHLIWRTATETTVINTKGQLYRLVHTETRRRNGKQRRLVPWEFDKYLLQERLCNLDDGTR